MNATHKMLASLLTLVAASLVSAADPVHPARVIAIQDVITDDPTGYAAWIAKTNAVAATKNGVDTYIHVYVSTFDGEKTNSVRAVIAADSIANLHKNAAALENNPELLANREHMRAIRKLGGQVVYQALRFDGTYKRSSVYTTLAVISDEAAYLKALDGLKAIFDAHGFADVKINAYRVMAGRTNYTHRINLTFENEDRLAAMLDFVASSPDLAEWLAGTAKIRTVVSNGTARDITP